MNHNHLINQNQHSYELNNLCVFGRLIYVNTEFLHWNDTNNIVCDNSSYIFWWIKN